MLSGPALASRASSSNWRFSEFHSLVFGSTDIYSAWSQSTLESGGKPAYVLLHFTLRCNAVRSNSFREHVSPKADMCGAQADVR